MEFLIKRTVIAATRLEVGDVVAVEMIGTDDQVARLIELGAIEPVDGAAAPTEPTAPLPEMDDALRAAMIQAVNSLPAEGFTSSGKPSVEALQAALPDQADRITAAARDAVWDEMKAAADAAS